MANNDRQACKTVLIGVTGCIAAYKAAELVRSLQKADIRVKVVMTEHATEFVGPATFRALTREKVAIDLFDDPADPIHHISLAQEADAFVIAPCTANVIAKIAHGIADDLLTTTALATTSPLIIAPAMNVNMYEDAVTQGNLETLRARGVLIVDADDGYLACGDVGRGRLAEPDAIVEAVLEALERKDDLAGKRVIATAGPTVEAIDPVRCVTNHSTGKMGYALAEAAAARGADVVLVSGPVSLPAPAKVRLVSVVSAQDMLEAVEAEFATCDIAVFSAAVCDMRPVGTSGRKLKKGKDDKALSHIELEPTPDILATMGRRKEDRVVIGFAAETESVLENAQAKLASKCADMIVANEVGEGKGFGTEGNKAWLVTKGGIVDLPFMSKRKLADAIFDSMLSLSR